MAVVPFSHCGSHMLVIFGPESARATEASFKSFDPVFVSCATGITSKKTCSCPSGLSRESGGETKSCKKPNTDTFASLA